MDNYIPDEKDLNTVYPHAVRVLATVPSIVCAGECFDVRLALLRADGYPADQYEGVLHLKNTAGFANLPDRVTFTKEHKGQLVIPNLYIEHTGIYTFDVVPQEGSFPSGTSNPVWVKDHFPYRLYWGDLHVHSVIGKCGTPHLPKSPDYGYWYAKTVAGHNFCAITDHAKAMNEEDWRLIEEAAARWHEPGRFVSVLGFEGDYDGPDGGHFNLYFDKDHGVPKNFLQKAGGTLDAIFSYAKEHDAIAISHHAGRSQRGRDFSISRFGGQSIEPVMEVYSQWGSSEEYESSRPIIEGRHKNLAHYYRYAIKNGYRFGVIGGSDNHCTVPGGPVPMIYPQWGGKMLFPYPGGIAGIYAKELTRESLFEAIRERRCFAASFEKILLWIECGGHGMGEEFSNNEAALTITAAGAHGAILEVEIVKNGETAVVFSPEANPEMFDEKGKIFETMWKDPHFDEPSAYYVRITQFDGDMAWSSPMWIEPVS